MITDNKRVDFGPLFLRDAPDVRKAGGNMSRRDEYEQKAEALLAPIVEGQGFELVDVEYVKEAGNWYLRGYIDKPGGITVNDCEAVSRAFDPVLDAEDPIDTAYTFEVSSAGADRPLKRKSDFERYMGSKVDVKLYKAKDGRKDFSGILKSYDEGNIVLETAEKDIEFDKSEIAIVRLAVEF